MKITATTFKAFIEKNRENLFVRVRSAFDGMTDGCEACSNIWEPAKASNLKNSDSHTVGVQGVWLVGQSRDSFTAKIENAMIVISVYNCCGAFAVGVPMDKAPKMQPALAKFFASQI